MLGLFVCFFFLFVFLFFCFFFLPFPESWGEFQGGQQASKSSQSE